MSTTSIKQRLERLENKRDSGRSGIHILEAASPDEAAQKEADLIASGDARATDLFIVIRRMPWLARVDDPDAPSWRGLPT
ncbi:MAG: hypothetical protein J0I42_20250 [Bosea sp.]|uniref:hypothetical protein n=1 Tax=Bosea sp. (in: a-proteobacteria) TaxID=1871050 RepID=UPI001AC09DBD|nr:hypothetical protein [Bosea sp. (in: a-proteobacteria)]MBN9454275.1 hypothetical protein [Bosea sp. (in: a-proteobacteria)]